MCKLCIPYTYEDTFKCAIWGRLAADKRKNYLLRAPHKEGEEGVASIAVCGCRRSAVFCWLRAMCIRPLSPSTNPLLVFAREESGGKGKRKPTFELHLHILSRHHPHHQTWLSEMEKERQKAIT